MFSDSVLCWLLLTLCNRVSNQLSYIPTCGTKQPSITTNQLLLHFSSDAIVSCLSTSTAVKPISQGSPGSRYPNRWWFSWSAYGGFLDLRISHVLLQRLLPASNRPCYVCCPVTLPHCTHLLGHPSTADQIFLGTSCSTSLMGTEDTETGCATRPRRRCKPPPGP